MKTIHRRPTRRTAQQTHHPRFGRTSTYSLTERELRRHIRQCRRAGWARWELHARFGRSS